MSWKYFHGSSRATAFAVSLLLAIFPYSQPELFTALVDLEKILHAEKDLARDLRTYISREESRLGELKRIANDYESHSIEALANPERHLANPVNAFLLVKRFTTDWAAVQENFIRGNASDEFLQSLAIRAINFPRDEDLSGAATALLRLQDTYALTTEKIARGDLQGIQHSPALTAEECFELGRHAYVNRDYYHSVMWMDEALSRVENEYQPSVSRATVLDFYAYSTAMQGNLDHALTLTKELLIMEPTHQRALNNKHYYEKTLSEEAVRKKGDDGVPPAEIKNERLLDDYRQSVEFSNYEALCRGETTTPVVKEHLLTCQFKRHHPMFYIDPLREETVNFKPWIVVYHDVLTDRQINQIRGLATPKLDRATVQNPLTGKLETAQYRVSKSGWIRDEEDGMIKKLSHRTGAFCNLTLDTVEELQVVNYGIGGQYEPHYDFARKTEPNSFDEWRGNRILTAIYYLTDVLAGGYTVFPEIGIKVAPRKGSCAVWYNLLANGEGDMLTRHAGCPVLTGIKWVANKWFHERGQEFVRKCDLNPDI